MTEKMHVAHKEEMNVVNNAPQEYFTLRFRSTGLGKTLLEGEPLNMKKQ